MNKTGVTAMSLAQRPRIGVYRNRDAQNGRRHAARALLDSQGGRFQLADQVGTVHDVRFVLFDNDTKLVFATTYDSDYDNYISDATKMPNGFDRLFSEVEGWPGIRSAAAGDFTAHQITASRAMG